MVIFLATTYHDESMKKQKIHKTRSIKAAESVLEKIL